MHAYPSPVLRCPASDTRMEVLIYLVPMALLLGLLGLGGFLWALNTGQYDDLEVVLRQQGKERPCAVPVDLEHASIRDRFPGHSRRAESEDRFQTVD